MVLTSDALTVDLPLPNEERLTALKLICKQNSLSSKFLDY